MMQDGGLKNKISPDFTEMFSAAEIELFSSSENSQSPTVENFSANDEIIDSTQTQLSLDGDRSDDAKQMHNIAVAEDKPQQCSASNSDKNINDGPPTNTVQTDNCIEQTNRLISDAVVDKSIACELCDKINSCESKTTNINAITLHENTIYKSNEKHISDIGTNTKQHSSATRKAT